MVLDRLKRIVFGNGGRPNGSQGAWRRGPAPRDEGPARGKGSGQEAAPRGWPAANPGGPGAPPGMGWRWFAWFAVLIFLAMMLVDPGTSQQQVESIPYSEFKAAVRDGRVAELTIEGEEVRGDYAGFPSQTQQRGESADVGQSQSAGPGRFTTIMPSVDDPELMPLLEEHGVTVNAESPGGPWWARILLGTLPWLLLIGVLIYVSYRMQRRMMNDGGGPFSFGRSPAKREVETGIGFDDVAGVETAKGDLAEIVDYLKDPQRYRSLGAKIPKGVLLLGSPGTGKTLLARAVAGEAGVPFYSISGSAFIEMFVGIGAKRVRGTFQEAKKEAPSIVFIDEIDSVGRSRGAGLGGGHDEREQTLNQILNEMDGFEPHENVIVLAATNRPDVLDAALMRPGRFDRKVALNLPDRKARESILSVHMRGVEIDQDVDTELIARRTVGFAGADLANLVNEAALLAGRDRRDRVDMACFERARDRIVLGAPHDSILSDEQRRVVAYHESGHALTAWLLPEADPLDKVTVIPRGRALGATEQTPVEDQYNVKRSYLLDRIGVMLGGRVAEKVVFGDVTNGAEADLSQVTQLVQRMICRWGMSERLGAVSFRRGEEHVFLGRELAQSRDFSEQTARDIDEEVHRIVSEQEARVEQLLKQNRHRLERLAETLLERETVHADEAARIFDKADREDAQVADRDASGKRREAAHAG